MTATLPASQRLRRTLAHTGVLARRDLLATVRLRDVLVLSAIQPIVFMLLFLYVSGGAIEAALPPAANGEYVNWLVPGDTLLALGWTVAILAVVVPVAIPHLPAHRQLNHPRAFAPPPSWVRSN